MSQIKAFDLNRIGLLIKKEILYQRRAPWIIVGAVFVFLLGFNVLMASEDPGPNDLPSNQVLFYVITLLVLGTVFTSAAFNELNNKSSAHHYLSIPASHLEKLISKWLITGFFYVIAFNIFYTIFCAVCNTLVLSLFDVATFMFNPFGEHPQMINGKTPWFFSSLYLALHTTYLAGAVYFRKYSYFKTMIAQSFISLTVLGLTAAIGSLFFMDIWAMEGSTVQVQADDTFKNMVENVFPNLGKILLWVVFPLWMLTYSYFKLKETEV